MPKRGNGEGSLYKTVQKIKRKKVLDVECKICSSCTDRTACDNRIGFKKCDKCKDCKEECLIYCDRFNCYERFVAQVTANGKQRTIATATKQREATKKKTENLSKIDNGKYIDKNSITLSQQMRNTQEYNLQNEQISESGYVRNMDSVKAIESKCPDIAFKKLQEITEDDILNILRSKKNNSQSVIEKTYDVINLSIKRAIRDKLLSEDNNPIENIDRDAILSNKETKKAIPFTIEETKKLIEYVNTHEEILVDDQSHIDSISMKNLIKLSLAFGTRCGEIGALNIDKHINFIKKKIIVERTLTKNKQDKIIIGSYTKTGRKAKRSGKKDVRDVPFGIIYPEDEIENILKEQIEIAQSIEGNKDNLLFCNKDGSYIDVKHITCMFKRICRAAEVKLELPTGCHIHMTKHTVVTRLIELGMNIYAISKLVGTTRAVLEKTYAHILDDFVESEIEKTKENRRKQHFTIATEEPEEERKVVNNVIHFKFGS